MTPYHKHIISIIFFSLLIAGQTISQETVFRNYKVKDGLPSSEIYHCFQDSKGYIWFGTDCGISRFDGYAFNNYDIQSGLAASNVSEIFEDKNGRIWVASIDGKISFYENSRFYPYLYNDRISNKLSGGYRLMVKNSLYVDSLNNVYISMIAKGIFKISPQGILSNVEKNDCFKSIIIEKQANGKLLTGFLTRNEVQYFCINNKQIQSKFNKVYSGTSLLFLAKGNENDLFVCFNKMIYKITGNKAVVVSELKSDILWFSRDKHGRYWLSVRGEGMKCYEDDDFTKQPKEIYLKGMDVSSFMIDNEGGYWFTTLESGIFYIPDVKLNILKQIEFQNKHITSLAVTNKKIYLGTVSGELIIYSKKNGNQIAARNLFNEDYATNILYSSNWDKIIIGTNNNVYLYQDVHLKSFKNPDTFELKKVSTHRSVKCLKIFDSETFYSGTNRSLDKHNIDSLIQSSLFEEPPFTEIVYDIVVNNDKSLWLATDEGLYKYQNGQYFSWQTKNKLLVNRINALYQYRNYLYMGTKGAGLYVMNLSDNSVKVISSDDGLSSNYINCIAGDKDNLWLGTNKGINNLKFLSDQIFSVGRIDIGSGLLSREINKIAIDGDIIYIATKEGLNYFNWHKFKWSAEKPTMHIENMFVNYKDTSFLKKLQLQYNKNNIEVRFKAISYKSNREIEYRYRLLPIEKEWKTTKQLSVNYNNLPPGNFNFEIKARNESGVWSDTNNNLTFNIEKPYWKKWWFYILAFLLILTLLYLFFFQRIRILKEQNLIRKKMNDFMQNALKLVVNEHFLFNSLNSLNHLILNGDKMESSKMLIKISNYIRATLSSAKKNIISLSDEINLLKLYFEIEKQRLKTKFSYELIIDKELDLHQFFIPATFLQPYIEASIWTGGLLEDTQIKVIIQMEKEREFAVIRVRYTTSNHISQNQNHSNQKAINKTYKISKNIRARTKLYNSLYNWNIVVENEPYGTNGNNSDSSQLKIMLNKSNMIKQTKNQIETNI